MTKHILQCENCNVTFNSRTKRSWCSLNCKKIIERGKAKQRAKDENYKIERNGVCFVCKESFYKKSTHHKYCSDKCRSEIMYENLLQKNDKTLRLRIFARDNFACVYCGKNSYFDKVKLSIDHIIPLSKGGVNKVWNLATACRECNFRKGVLMLNKNLANKIIDRNKYLGASIDDEIIDSRVKPYFQKHQKQTKNKEKGKWKILKI